MMIMKVKYRKGSYVKDTYGRGKGIVDKIDTNCHEPFYTLEDGNGVFWESELEIDDQAREERLNELLDNDNEI